MLSCEVYKKRKTKIKRKDHHIAFIYSLLLKKFCPIILLIEHVQDMNTSDSFGAWFQMNFCSLFCDARYINHLYYISESTIYNTLSTATSTFNYSTCQCCIPWVNTLCQYAVWKDTLGTQYMYNKYSLQLVTLIFSVIINEV